MKKISILTLSFVASTFISESLNAIKVKLEWGNELSQVHRNAFVTASQRWEAILIDEDLPRVEGNGGYDVVIRANAINIDGIGNTLAEAGPTEVRKVSYIPSRAVMKFDAADLNQMASNGSLIRVITHEMAHALGFGSIWEYLKLTNENPQNPQFLGKEAMEFYQSLNKGRLEGVPLENIGGRGTFGSHWKKSIFGNELMTGFIDPTSSPLSGLTLAAFEDMGYRVNYAKAESYNLPRQLLVGAAYPGEKYTYTCHHKTICPKDVSYSQIE